MAVPARPRVVAVLAALVTAILVASAAAVGERLPAVGVGVLAGLVVVAGWPSLVRSKTPRGTSAVLAVTTVALAAALLLRSEEPLLLHVPVAVAAGVVAMCLQPLVQEDARLDLVHTLAGTSLGILLIICGGVLLTTAQVNHHTAVVGTVATALAALVDLGLERAGTVAWLLPAAMVVGGVVGVVAHLALGGVLSAWPALVGVLAAGAALCLRRALSPQAAMDTVHGALAAGVASVLLVGPVLHLAARLPLA